MLLVFDANSDTFKLSSNQAIPSCAVASRSMCDPGMFSCSFIQFKDRSSYGYTKTFPRGREPEVNASYNRRAFRRTNCTPWQSRWPEHSTLITGGLLAMPVR